MIERSIKDILADVEPSVNWTVNYKPGDLANVSTVYYEGGRDPSGGDEGMRRPLYMVYIRHSDYRQAELIAQNVFDRLYSQKEFVAIEWHGQVKKQYRVYDLQPGEPIRIGVNDNSDEMEFSVNIQAYIIEEAI